MPRSAPTPCRSPGCPALAHADWRGFCATHGPRAKREDAARRRGRRAPRRAKLCAPEKALEAFYGSPRWKAVRKAYFVRSPLCEHCDLNGRLTPGAVVDHIVERRDGGADYDHSNLQTLCHACHNKKTKIEASKRNNPLNW